MPTSPRSGGSPSRSIHATWPHSKRPASATSPLTAPYMHDGSVATLAEAVELAVNDAFPDASVAGGYLPLAATLTTEEVYDAFLGTRAELKQFFTDTRTPPTRSRVPSVSSLWRYFANRP
jgi:hypothetical protein